MLKVKARLKPSAIQGIGLHAAEFIPKGSIVWSYTPGIDIVYPSQQIRLVNDPAALEFLCIYTYYSRLLKGYILCGDHARFVNHSEECNLASGGGEVSIATRDILEGEEITDNYFLFDQPGEEDFIPEMFAFEEALRKPVHANGHSNGTHRLNGLNGTGHGVLVTDGNGTLR